MIPKVIHFVWVGDKPKTQLVLNCINSWRTHCPDYHIIEWNNTSVEKIDNQYVREAFAAKKWAFVSDYIRLYALFKYGGIYCDSDLEITQPLDSFRDNKFFTGYEKYKGNTWPLTALMGSTKKNRIVKDMLEEYRNIRFIINDQMDLTTNVIRISKYFDSKFDLSAPYNGNEITQLAPRCNIYPSYFFCTPEPNKVNYAIHHFNGSWGEPYSRKKILEIGNISFIKFKKKKIQSKEILPINGGEKIIFNLKINQTRSLALISTGLKR